MLVFLTIRFTGGVQLGAGGAALFWKVPQLLLDLVGSAGLSSMKTDNFDLDTLKWQ